MKEYIHHYLATNIAALQQLSHTEIAKAIGLLQATYERDGRIYIFGNGGSLALATHWVADFNKTAFSHNLDQHPRRFQAIRLPSTEEELSAWANDVGFEMVFAGPLQNYLQESDCVIAISSSGNSPNIIKAVEFAKSRHVPVIGLSGFDGGRLAQLSDAALVVYSKQGDYGTVEGVHAVLLHLITMYFQAYFDHVISRVSVYEPTSSHSLSGS